MCYQCSGCGRCQENGDAGLPKKCPRCNKLIEDDIRLCPSCGMYIRPASGSIKTGK
ncbi:MAG: hypothetical protein HGA54_03545 [Actinobacteria bacterium]|nr:hypothetical protein [Actinomycetota bacterium]